MTLYSRLQAKKRERRTCRIVSIWIEAMWLKSTNCHPSVNLKSQTMACSDSLIRKMKMVSWEWSLVNRILQAKSCFNCQAHLFYSLNWATKISSIKPSASLQMLACHKSRLKTSKDLRMQVKSANQSETWLRQLSACHNQNNLSVRT